MSSEEFAEALEQVKARLDAPPPPEVLPGF